MSEEQIKGEENFDNPESLRILEAIIFASDEVLTVQRIRAILPNAPDSKMIKKMVSQINALLQQQQHPFEILEVGGGFQFRTVSYYQPWVQQLFKETVQKKLSMQALECLAIIAYKQPISKAEIESVRGVMSDGAMKTLLERHLVTITGRSDKPGRPLLYGTTPEFLNYFGINKITDLPRIEEFETLAKQKLNELTREDLSTISESQNTDEEKSTMAVSSSSDELVVDQVTVSGSNKTDLLVDKADQEDGDPQDPPVHDNKQKSGLTDEEIISPVLISPQQI